MEPLFVEALDLDERDPDPLNIGPGQEDVSHKLFAEIDNLRSEILRMKKDLFDILVHKDQDHEAVDMGAMMRFHALYLQAVAFWIGLLDDRPVPSAEIPGKAKQRYDAITKFVESQKNYSTDSRTLLYNLFFQLSTQHPFDFQEVKESTAL